MGNKILWLLLIFCLTSCSCQERDDFVKAQHKQVTIIKTVNECINDDCYEFVKFSPSIDANLTCINIKETRNIYGQYPTRITRSTTCYKNE